MQQDECLTKAVDEINQKLGSDTGKFATAKIGRKLEDKKHEKSKAYTTNWNELMTFIRIEEGKLKL